MSDKTTKIDHLKEDEPIPGQKFALLSIVTPELIKNCSVRGIKIRGVYGNEQEARSRATELQKSDALHNIYVAPVGKWLPWDDDPSKAQDEEYAETELNRIMKGLKENQAKSKMLHEQRKNDLIEKTLKDQEKRKKKLSKQTNNSTNELGNMTNKKSSDNNPSAKVELEPVHPNDMESINQKYNTKQTELQVHELTEQLDKTKNDLEQEDKNIKKDKSIIEDKSTNINKINSELEEAQKLYEQLSSSQ